MVGRAVAWERAQAAVRSAARRQVQEQCGAGAACRSVECRTRSVLADRGARGGWHAGGRDGAGGSTGMKNRSDHSNRSGRSIIGVVLLCAIVAACGGGRDSNEIRIPRGAGGVGFLPLLVMEKHRLIEKHAKDAGVPDLTVRWVDLGGPSVVND